MQEGRVEVAMRILVFLSFCLAILLMLGLGFTLWTENPHYGVGGLVGIVAFFIAYAISGDMIIAPRDFWRLSSWQVFRKKIGYALTAYIIATFVAAGVLGACFG